MQIPGESIGIIADDLTGACDTALQFHMEGANTRILLDYTVASQTQSIPVWVTHTDSRHLDPPDAVATVCKAVHFLKEQLGLDRFYKKIDSTLRGHIAQECLAILDALQWSAAVIAPAYPDEDRRTVGGYQLVRGLPVGQTEIARDPLFPVRESHLPTLLAKSADSETVGYICLRTVMDGAGPILKALQDLIQQQKKLIVVDACSDTDLEQLSLAINKLPSDLNVLPCGSAGLAKALSRKWVLHQDHPPAPHVLIERSPMLMVVGSNNPRTREQIRYFETHFHTALPASRLQLVSLSPAQILGLEPVTETIQQVIALLEDHVNVIMSTSYEPGCLEKTLIMAEEQQITHEAASQKAAHLLGRVTQEVLKQLSPKLVLSGGETAHTVCRAIGTRSLQVVDAVETSIPLTIDEHARWIVTKSGGFGSPMCLLNIVTALRDLESQEDVQHVG